MLNPKLILTLMLSLFFAACHSAQEKTASRWLEDIPFDNKIDSENFVICNGEENVFQYFNQGDNIEIEGDKPKIISTFKEQYNSEIVPKESGLIRIRFIVNCNGETDRFRVIQSDLDYQPIQFHKNITEQLLDITKSLTGWKQKLRDEQPVDYYQYLIFKIVEGKIEKILP